MGSQTKLKVRPECHLLEKTVSIIINISLLQKKKYLCKYLLAYIFASKYLHFMEARRDVFQAIADPTRREIINMVAIQPLNLNAVAEKFDMSRQAVSLHVKILTECGLIVIKQQGRERYCEAKLDSLSEVAKWIDQYKQHWENKLDSLENYLSKIQKTKRYAKRKR
jgi:DNA-binding transcriptional ArsR family regulator